MSPLPFSQGKLLPTTHDNGDAELQRLLASHSIPYTSISHIADGYIVSLNPKQQVILARNKGLAEQISSLQIILPQLTMEGRNFSSVDLRFDKPIIRY